MENWRLESCHFLRSTYIPRLSTSTWPQQLSSLVGGFACDGTREMNYGDCHMLFGRSQAESPHGSGTQESRRCGPACQVRPPGQEQDAGSPGMLPYRPRFADCDLAAVLLEQLYRSRWEHLAAHVSRFCRAAGQSPNRWGSTRIGLREILQYFQALHRTGDEPSLPLR